MVPVGLCFGENKLWLATASGYIEKRMMDDKLTLLSRYKFPGAGISGICHDGLYFWTADRKEGKIRRHITDRELTVEKSYVYPGNDLAALACGPEFLWTLDEDSSEILEHALDEPEYVLSRKTLREYRKGKWKIAGLACGGRQPSASSKPAGSASGRWAGQPKRRFWSVAEGKNKGMVFIHDIKVEGVHTGFD